MRARAIFPVVAAVLGAAAVANADDRRIGIGVRSGAELPAGGIEKGSQASDLTYGALPFALDAEVSLSRIVNAGLWASYAFTVPKLCATASDCTQSGGHDVEVGAMTRYALPRVMRVTPMAETGLGYEWSARVLQSSGVRSTRTFEGPIARLALVPTLSLSSHVTLGLVFGGRIGVAYRVGIDAPGVTQSRGPDGATIGGTVDLALRLGVTAE